jgi:ElaB/YqjD/DUF883 family membrane-anchored ribosome-binding protein
MKALKWSLMALLVLCLSNEASGALLDHLKDILGGDARKAFKDAVQTAKNSQHEAVNQFKDTYEELKNISGFQGGELEERYKILEGSYNRSLGKANDVRSRIKAVENAADKLFSQWNSEIKQMTNDELRRSSREKYCKCITNFDELWASLKRAEKSMDPVIDKFKELVLYVKHNLNAQAVASLKGEVEKIQLQVNNLISEMNAAVEEAERFIRNSPELDTTDSKEGKPKS